MIAARVSTARDQVEVYASSRTPQGTVQPSVLVRNVEDSAVLSAELRAALERVAGKQRDVAVVIPDAAVRVTILDFDQLPADDEDARAVVRLRFRRNVPFEAEDASVSFQRLPSRVGTEVRVLAVAMPRIALEGYEKAVRDAGYFPGVVVNASLAALGAIDASTPCMVVRHVPSADAGGTPSTTIVIASWDVILLYRNIEGSAADSVLDDVYSALVFYEDNFRQKLETVYLDGVSVNPESALSLKDNAGATLRTFPQVLSGQNLSGDSVAGGTLAPLAGVLLG
ncbi:MAG: hypothetical protein NVS9B15_19860 [Acidobacteriaceae bacterium]